MNEIMWINKWVERAKNDLLVAQNVFHAFYPKQLEICCYQCHQSAESALCKAEQILTFCVSLIFPESGGEE